MDTQIAEKKKKILLFWDRAAHLSRARLEQDLARILGETASLLGQVGP
jgi:hypothetical protein